MWSVCTHLVLQERISWLFQGFLDSRNEPLVNPEPIEDGEIRASFSLTLVHSPGTDLRGHVGSVLSPGNPRKAGWNPAAPRAARTCRSWWERSRPEGAHLRYCHRGIRSWDSFVGVHRGCSAPTSGPPPRAPRTSQRTNFPEPDPATLCLSRSGKDK